MKSFNAWLLEVISLLFGTHVGQYRIILSADTASEARQLPERCLSRKAGIMRCCLRNVLRFSLPKGAAAVHFSVVFSPQKGYNNLKFCIA